LDSNHQMGHTMWENAWFGFQENKKGLVKGIMGFITF